MKFSLGTKSTSRQLSILYRISRPDAFCKKGALKNFPKFEGKHLYHSFFFNKVAGVACNFIKKETPMACNFIKKETLVQVFSCELCEFFKSIFFHRKPSVVTSVCNIN